MRSPNVVTNRPGEVRRVEQALLLVLVEQALGGHQLADVDPVERPAMRGGRRPQLVLRLRQADEQAPLARRRAGPQELRGDRRLAGARAALEQEDPPPRQAAAQHVVQAGDAGRRFHIRHGYRRELPAPVERPASGLAGVDRFEDCMSVPELQLGRALQQRIRPRVRCIRAVRADRAVGRRPVLRWPPACESSKVMQRWRFPSPGARCPIRDMPHDAAPPDMGWIARIRLRAAGRL